MHFLVAETAKAMRDSGQANQKRQLADVAGRLRRGPAVILPPPPCSLPRPAVPSLQLVTPPRASAREGGSIGAIRPRQSQSAGWA